MNIGQADVEKQCLETSTSWASKRVKFDGCGIAQSSAATFAPLRFRLDRGRSEGASLEL